MRKALLLGTAIVIMGSFFAPAGVHGADGTCVATAKKPQVGGGQNTHIGGYDCGATNHSTMAITLYAQRRQVGGSWNILEIDSHIEQDGNATISELISLSGYDCRKDYRTRVDQASASPGGHSGTDNSPIAFHTC